MTMRDLIVRALTALLVWVDRPRPRPEADAPPWRPARPPRECPPPLPRHKSPYAADTGPLSPTGTVRPYAPAAWHRPHNAADRLTHGRRRAELWLATHGFDAPWPVRPHGVTLGGGGRYHY
jgi:hypothetical protein